MKFLRLFDPLLSVLFENEDILAIDKPYGFNAHTNDSKIENSDYIQDGLIEIFEKNFNRKLHIIHRLDQTTTGVMIFGKSQESAKKYAEFFFNRQVQKTYWFITQNKSKKDQFNISSAILHKGKNLDAITDLSLIKKSSGYELWQALPHTGRNHQIRIHAQTADLSILGDETYGGAQYPFLCLHNCKIEFPNGLSLNSTPPKYFTDLSLLLDVSNVRKIFEADRRNRLFSKATDEQCFRLLHHKNKFKNQDLTIDHLGRMLVSQPAHPSESVPTEPWIAKEDQLSFELQIDSKNNVGLFTNQRLQRHWVFKNSNNKHVLNLFSYTGTYSTAAAAGGAVNVTSVDMSKNNHNWARRNFCINQISENLHTFLLRDSFSYIESCKNKNIKFDLIICDVPAFYRREKGVFKIETDLFVLIENCLTCLNPEGDFLLSTTADELFIDTIRATIEAVQKKLGLTETQLYCILPSLDFELAHEKANLKSFLVQKKLIDTKPIA
jgi:23S rRNA (cytosine1962-C5)-methyltransferase